MSSGVGGHNRPSNTTDAGITPIHDARLTRMAITRGWLKGQRWPTRETVEEFQERVANSGATLIDRAVLTTQKLMMSGDARAQGIAIKSALAMEAQNQSDDHREEGASVHEAPVGCSFTPDQIAAAMDATIPGSPEEEATDDSERHSPDADSSVDAAEVPPGAGEVLPQPGPVPSGGCGPEIW